LRFSQPSKSKRRSDRNGRVACNGLVLAAWRFRSQQTLGDIKSIFVFNKWQHMVMPKYTNLSDSQILLILDYVDSFEYVEMNNGLDHYSHRKLSINSMKDSIKAYEEKNGKY
jgi:hypothetical protein